MTDTVTTAPNCCVNCGKALVERSDGVCFREPVGMSKDLMMCAECLSNGLQFLVRIDREDKLKDIKPSSRNLFKIQTFRSVNTGKEYTVSDPSSGKKIKRL